MSRDLYGVLTGDLVGSSVLALPVLDEIRDFLQKMPAEFNSAFPNALRKGVDIVRGDGWQLLVLQPRLAVRAALYTRFSLKAGFGVDSRVSVGIGRVAALHRSALAKSSGAAFQLSGGGLDDLAPDCRMAYAVEGENAHLAAAEQLLVRWLDRLTTTATQAQSASLAGTLLKKTQSELARTENVTQPTINRKLHASGWPDIEVVLAYLENIAVKSYND